MVGYFPAPYKNEAMYSIISRYAHHYSIKSRQQVFRALFSGNLVAVNPEYVNRIQKLTTKINHFSKEYTENYFLKNHTTAPLYAPFIKEEKNNLDDTLKKYYKTRKTSVEIQAKEHLYYCSECLKEQYEVYGEGFWDRLYQAPGVWVCFKHKRFLNRNRTNIVREPSEIFEIPKYELISCKPIHIKVETLEALLQFASNIKYIFENEIKMEQLKNLYKRYLYFMRISGITSTEKKVSSRVKEKLKNLVSKKFNKEVLGVLDPNDINLNWVDKYFYENGIKYLHPIRHIILMVSLTDSVKSFYEAEILEPFGDGPWICMSPFCDHFLERYIEEVKIKFHPGKETLQGDFICKCGFAYRLFYGEKNPLEVKTFNNRVIERGELWERGFYSLANSGISPPKIAKKVNLEVHTVRKLLKETPNSRLKKLTVKQKTKERNILHLKKAYRISWKKLKEDNPLLSRQELYKLDKSVYSWLCKNDKEWFDKNSPVSRMYSLGPKNLEYSSRDKKLLEEAKKISRDWSSYEKREGKLKRKSNYAFCLRLKVDNRLKFKGDKYPLTVNYLKAEIESTIDFQLRKLAHTLETDYKDQFVTRNKLVIETNLYCSIKQETEERLKSLIINHNKEISNKQRGIINGKTKNDMDRE